MNSHWTLTLLLEINSRSFHGEWVQSDIWVSVKCWLFWFPETYKLFENIEYIFTRIRIYLFVGIESADCVCESSYIKREYKGLHPFGAHSAIDRPFSFRASFFRDRRTVESYWKFAPEPNRFSIFYSNIGRYVAWYLVACALRFNA